ncbi:MAG: hypothetical protein WBD36_17120 [Bacteroidota bacterium]
MRAYLSGGMEYAKDEGVDWRNMIELWLKCELNHSAFNPNVESNKYLRRKLPGQNIRKLKFRDVLRFSKILRGVVDLDSAEIARNSDYVICYWDESAQKGAGTKGEITIAKYFRKPVYLITTMKLEDIPGWVLGCATQFFPSFDELKKFLLRKYKTRSEKL